VDVSPAIGGHVLSNGDEELDSYPAYESLAPDESITFEAVPSPGYRFDHWSREMYNSHQTLVYSTDRVVKIDAGCDIWITANFSPIMPAWLIAVIAVAVAVPLTIRRRMKRLRQRVELNRDEPAAQ